MEIVNESRAARKLCCAPATFFARVLSIGIAALTGLSSAVAQTPFREQLKSLPFKIAHECYVNDNWEIFVMNADGSGAINFTQTPNIHEHYPQISPDGTKLCFSVDEGEGREAIRSLHVMD